MSNDSSNPDFESEAHNLAEPSAPEANEVSLQTGNTAWRDWAMRIFTVVLWSGIALAITWFAGGKKFLTDHWTAVVGLLVIAMIVASVPSTQRWYNSTNAQRRIGLVTIVLIVAIAALFFVVFLLEPKYQAALLRTIFLVIVCSLPALMYYLFIATKKYSLLNEFTQNLTRLGLVHPKRVPPELVLPELLRETEQQREKRFFTYIQKFEAVYGAIPTKLSGKVLQPIESEDLVPEDKQESLGETEGLATKFTVDTTIPVIAATLLIALGWLITLPPWQGRLILTRQITQTATESQATGALPVVPQPQPSPGAGATAQPSPTPTEEQVATEKWLSVYNPILSPVRFAFIGAYFFTLQMLFRRYVRRDLRSSAYVAVSLRLILSVIGIWVVVEAVKMGPSSWMGAGQQAQTVEKSLLVLGFVIGVFPRVGWQVIQASIKRVCSIAVPSLQTQLPLSDLDGLTVWHEARLEEEDIENIPNMATADLVDLFINTRFPPDRIIDWVDQAILYTHLGPQPKENGKAGLREILRGHGIRSATSLIETYNQSEFHHDREALEEIMPTVGRKTMRSLVDAIGTNPVLKMIQTWKGLSPHLHAPAPIEPGQRLPANGAFKQASQPVNV